MYHAVEILLLDQHTHRFLWQNFETSHDRDIFVITSVSFGDKPAENIATTALWKTAEMGEDRYPDAASVILKNTYADDIVDSVNDNKEAVELTKQKDELLEPGGFKVQVTQICGFYIFSYFKNMGSNRGFHKVLSILAFAKHV